MIKRNKSNELIIKADSVGYSIDNDGNVYNPKGLLLTQRLTKATVKRKTIYKFFRPYIPGFKKGSYIRTHKFQAYKKFGDKIFTLGTHIRHFNGDSLDNSWDNILIGSAWDNWNDIPDESRINKIDNAINARRKFTDSEVRYMRSISNLNIGIKKELALKYSVDISTINRILKGKRYAHVV